MKLDTDSLAHTKWNCKYHIVFAPKYRRQVIYGKIKSDIGIMLRRLCEYKGVVILEAEACKDHIHMLVSIPPKYSVSQIVGYLKGKSSLMIYLLAIDFLCILQLLFYFFPLYLHNSLYTKNVGFHIYTSCWRISQISSDYFFL